MRLGDQEQLRSFRRSQFDPLRLAPVHANEAIRLDFMFKAFNPWSQATSLLAESETWEMCLFRVSPSQQLVGQMRPMRVDAWPLTRDLRPVLVRRGNRRLLQAEMQDQWLSYSGSTAFADDAGDPDMLLELDIDGRLVVDLNDDDEYQEEEHDPEDAADDDPEMPSASDSDVSVSSCETVTTTTSSSSAATSSSGPEPLPAGGSADPLPVAAEVRRARRARGSAIRGPEDIIVEVDGGAIEWFSGSRDFVATCRCVHHMDGEEFTCIRKRQGCQEGIAAGHGRPLGMLLVWLQGGDQHETRDQHVKDRTFFLPCRAEAREAFERLELLDPDGPVAMLLSKERPLRTDERPEPRKVF